jgi:hypothetical protein
MELPSIERGGSGIYREKIGSEIDRVKWEGRQIGYKRRRAVCDVVQIRQKRRL